MDVIWVITYLLRLVEPLLVARGLLIQELRQTSAETSPSNREGPTPNLIEDVGGNVVILFLFKNISNFNRACSLLHLPTK